MPLDHFDPLDPVVLGIPGIHKDPGWSLWKVPKGKFWHTLRVLGEDHDFQSWETPSSELPLFILHGLSCLLCCSCHHRDELHWAHKFPRTRTSAWVYASLHHILWRKEISLESRVSSSISYYSIWKMICQGDLGPHEGKIRILMSRSLGEVKWMDFPEWDQNVKKKKKKNVSHVKAHKRPLLKSSL